MNMKNVKNWEKDLMERFIVWFEPFMMMMGRSPKQAMRLKFSTNLL